MTYTPHTEPDVQSMLAAIGVTDIEALFHDVPGQMRFPRLDLPSGKSQLEVARALETLSSQSVPASKTPSFLGAGAYHHYSPPVVDYLIQRGEFLTAYTPYQPEVSQGTLQAIFEYQSMICALTGMEVSNASHYDGATSLAEAVLMAHSNARAKRGKVVFCSGVHPEYRAVVRTYTQGLDVRCEARYSSVDQREDFLAAIDTDTSLVAVQYPDFFGQVHDYSAVVDAAHAAGALVVFVVDPVALGMLKPPGQLGADIVVAEGQALGLSLSYGGPYLGIFATREQYVRKMSGRLVGETEDPDGKSGYVLTLATREQHIRRERATSNICTNQGLMALASAVYLSAMGKNGLRKAAELCYHKSHYAAEQINALDGYTVDLTASFIKEFVVTAPMPAADLNTRLFDEYGIIGGFDLARHYPEREKQVMFAVTEMNARADIDALVAALKEIVS